MRLPLTTYQFRDCQESMLVCDVLHGERIRSGVGGLARDKCSILSQYLVQLQDRGLGAVHDLIHI